MHRAEKAKERMENQELADKIDSQYQEILPMLKKYGEIIANIKIGERKLKMKSKTIMKNYKENYKLNNKKYIKMTVFIYCLIKIC